MAVTVYTQRVLRLWIPEVAFESRTIRKQARDCLMLGQTRQVRASEGSKRLAESSKNI